MRLLKLLVILLLIVFPFGELLRFDLGNNIRFKPLDIISGLLLGSWLILLVTRKIKRPSIHWAFIIFPLVALGSLALNSVFLTSQELLISSFYLIRWVSYLSVFFIVQLFDEAFKKKVLLLLLVDGLVIVLLGFVQFFFFSSLKPLYYLGWDDHMYRMFSVFLDPNFTGGVLILYLLFVLGLLYMLVIDRKGIFPIIPHVGFLKVTKKQYKIGLSIIALLTLLAIFLTFSRSSLLMLIAGVSVFFILIGRKKLIMLLFCIIFIFTLLISPSFHVENINLFRQASSTARIGNYQTAIAVIQEQPFFGVGFNAYRYAKERYNIQTGWVQAPSHADAGVDNSFLFVLVTSGIAGFTAYLLLWGYLIKKAVYRYKKERNIFAVIVLSSTVGLFVHALFLNSLFFPAIMLWLWIQLGFMERTSH